MAFYSITALAAAITSFTTNLSGTPAIGQTLWIGRATLSGEASCASITHHKIFNVTIIISAAVSLLVQWIKQKTTNQLETLLVLLAISLAAAGLYCALVAVGYWETVANVLLIAGAFYAFVIQRFESMS